MNESDGGRARTVLSPHQPIGHDPDDLEQLAADLRIVSFRLARRLRLESLIEHITDAQLTVLMRLSHAGPATPGRLAELERVSAPSMNRTLNGLEEDGHIRRVDDPDDGRRVIVEPTDSGLEIARTARRLRNAWLKSELAPLSTADRAALARAVEILDGMIRP